jgi:hypothetical protein
MRFADRMVRTVNRALREAETAFCGIDMQETAKPHIFVGAAIDSAMTGEFLADRLIARELVSRQIRLAANRRHDLFAQRLGGNIGDVERTAIAIAIDKRHHDLLFRFLLGEGAVLFLAANESFVGLDNLVLSADRSWICRLHGLANAVAHEPCRLIRKPHHAAELKGAHALLTRHD